MGLTIIFLPPSMIAMAQYHHCNNANPQPNNNSPAPLQYVKLAVSKISFTNRVKELRLGYFYLWRDSSVTSAWRSQTAQTPTCTTSHLSFLFHLPCSNINVKKHHKSRTYNYPNSSITLHFEFIHCHRNQCLLTLHCFFSDIYKKEDWQ